MVLSGTLAGLVSVSYYLGTFASIQPKVLPPPGLRCDSSSPSSQLLSCGLSLCITVGHHYYQQNNIYVLYLRGTQGDSISDHRYSSACSEFVRAMVRKYRMELEEMSEEVAAHV